MKLLTILSGSALLACGILASCSHKPAEYTLNGETDEKNNDAKVLLISLSNGDTLGETTVAECKYVFSDTISTPQLAQLRIGGRASGTVVLEPGVILVQPRQKVSGTPLNDALGAYYAKMEEAQQQIGALNMENPEDKEQAEAIIEAINLYEDSLMNANLDNPVGASLFLGNAYDMSVEDLKATIEQHPSLGNYNKVQQIIGHKEKAAETAEGMPYKDFEIEYNGTTTKLSDLMTPGHYTLVDFWASWCGPCRREMPNLKEIRKEYGPKGLDIVGVAVWDENDKTEQAIEELGIEWPVIINGQRIPTDLYGILGIPTIILISPDGTILSRGKQGEELKAAVAEAMAAK